MARITYFESLTDNTVTNEVRLSSLFDPLSDPKLLNLCKLSFYLAQPMYTGADFKPIVNSNPNLNCIYINEDAGFNDEPEKDLVLEVLRMLVKTFVTPNFHSFKEFLSILTQKMPKNQNTF